jgi:hypothetical protein
LLKWFDFTIHSFHHASGYWTEIVGNWRQVGSSKSYQRTCPGDWNSMERCCNSGSQFIKDTYTISLESVLLLQSLSVFLLISLRLWFSFMVSEWSISIINFNGYCRKHMPVAMSSKFQIVPLISWRICKDCLMQIIFQIRYL